MRHGRPRHQASGRSVHGGASNTTTTPGCALPSGSRVWLASGVGAITVFLADDNVIIREGVRAMLERDQDIEVVGVAEDYDGLVGGRPSAASRRRGQRHPHAAELPARGHRRCKEIRKRHPGTGIVILSQYDDPDYAVVAAVARARPATPTCSRTASPRATSWRGRSARSPPAARCSTRPSSTALISPVRRTGGLSAEDDELLTMVATGRPIKAIAAARKTTAGRRRGRRRAAVREPRRRPCRRARQGRCERLRLLHEAIVEPRGAGRDAVPAAAGRRGRQAARRGPRHRRDRAARRHRADERHPRLHRRSPSTPTRPCWPGS